MKESIIKDNCKLCPKCNQFRPFSDFGVRPNGKIRSWCKPCGVRDTAEWRKKRGRWQNPLVGRIQTILSHVIKRGGEIRSEIIYELYQKQGGKCYYTGVEMLLMTNKKRHPLLMSIDRLDSALGYTKENVVLCCLASNHLKSCHSVKEFYDVLKILSDGARSLGKI